MANISEAQFLHIQGTDLVRPSQVTQVCRSFSISLNWALFDDYLFDNYLFDNYNQVVIEQSPSRRNRK